MNANRFRWLFVGLLSVAVCFARPAAQEEPQAIDVSALFDKTDVMISMRDRVRLHTEIYAPKNSAQPLPILLIRTPYGVLDDDKGYAFALKQRNELIADGYIFAFQDIRGRYKSEGQFVMNRPVRDAKDAKAIDEGTDTYDTIDWLVKNVPQNNGRVGMFGVSYGGWLTVMGMLEPHPALKAVSEQASPADMFLGDDFHHNGAFRLSYGFEYATMMETDKTNFSFDFDRADTFDWYLRLGALSNANKKYIHGKLPTWNDFVAHPNYDAFWKKQAMATILKGPRVPNLNVGGWWDQEDFYGPMTIYQILEKNDPDHLNYVVAGPWNHGGWAHGTGRSLGAIDFGSDTSKYFREKIQAPWFAYWLKDKGALPLREALVFETGSNRWVSYDSWPPKAATPRKLYFHGGGKLSFAAPAKNSPPEFDSYLSDPAHPVPYRHRPIEMTYPRDRQGGWPTWLVEDQRFVDHRPDVLSWESDALEKDLNVAGDIVVHLFASTTGSDSDWVVKLIDVYPEKYPQDVKMEGYELMIADEVFRGRFHKSFEKPEALVPNQVTPFTIDLHTNAHVFQKGHKVMVQVQSTWFPIIDRNPQKFVPNIFKATEADYQKATQKIYRSGQSASCIELPVLEP
ncbi:MAG TPA: CocE/NonD family hydrolase [Candidatus Acidoferrales bacterium]|nr:CocE/NonD family hydrolase [Candidatus Acidoferrales bacterium]